MCRNRCDMRVVFLLLFTTRRISQSCGRWRRRRAQHTHARTFLQIFCFLLSKRINGPYARFTYSRIIPPPLPLPLPSTDRPSACRPLPVSLFHSLFVDTINGRCSLRCCLYCLSNSIQLTTPHFLHKNIVSYLCGGGINSILFFFRSQYWTDEQYEFT